MRRLLQDFSDAAVRGAGYTIGALIGALSAAVGIVGGAMLALDCLLPPQDPAAVAWRREASRPEVGDDVRGEADR